MSIHCLYTKTYFAEQQQRNGVYIRDVEIREKLKSIHSKTFLRPKEIRDVYSGILLINLRRGLLGRSASALSVFQFLSKTMAEETATFSSCVSQFPCTLQTRDVTGCESSLVSHPSRGRCHRYYCWLRGRQNNCSIKISSKYEKVHMNFNMQLIFYSPRGAAAQRGSWPPHS